MRRRLGPGAGRLCQLIHFPWNNATVIIPTTPPRAAGTRRSFGRNPVDQWQISTQPLRLRVSDLLDVAPAFGATDHGAHAQDDDIDPCLFLASIDSRGPPASEKRSVELRGVFISDSGVDETRLITALTDVDPSSAISPWAPGSRGYRASTPRPRLRPSGARPSHRSTPPTDSSPKPPRSLRRRNFFGTALHQTRNFVPVSRTTKQKSSNIGTEIRIPEPTEHLQQRSAAQAPRPRDFAPKSRGRSTWRSPRVTRLAVLPRAKLHDTSAAGSDHLEQSTHRPHSPIGAGVVVAASPRDEQLQADRPGAPPASHLRNVAGPRWARSRAPRTSR